MPGIRFYDARELYNTSMEVLYQPVMELMVKSANEGKLMAEFKMKATQENWDNLKKIAKYLKDRRYDTKIKEEDIAEECTCEESIFGCVGKCKRKLVILTISWANSTY